MTKLKLYFNQYKNKKSIELLRSLSNKPSKRTNLFRIVNFKTKH